MISVDVRNVSTLRDNRFTIFLARNTDGCKMRRGTRSRVSEVPELLLKPSDAEIVTPEAKEYLSFGV